MRAGVRTSAEREPKIPRKKNRQGCLFYFEGPYGSGAVAAIDGDDLSSDVVRAATGKKHRERCYIFRLSEFGVGLRVPQPGLQFGGLPHVAVEIRQNEPRRDAVHLNIVAAPLGR